MSTNCERRRDLGAVQLAEATSSYSTSAVSCCAHSEQLNMSRSQPGVPVRAMSYSRIARPQLGHAGVLPTGCSDDLNKLNWGIAPLLHFLQIRSNGTCSVIGFATVCVSSWRELMSALGHKRTFAVQNGMSALPPKADMCGATRHVRFVPIADIRSIIGSVGRDAGRLVY